MKSLAELKELRNKVQKEMKKRDQGTRAEIIVGM
jgi:NADP-reducing hydrogenase subunit HndB